MEWTDGMEYQLTKIAKVTIVGGHGEVVSAVSTITSTITVREITALLVAYSQVAQADPSESCPGLTQMNQGKLGWYPLIAGYMQLASSKCWFIIRLHKLRLVPINAHITWYRSTLPKPWIRYPCQT